MKTEPTRKDGSMKPTGKPPAIFGIAAAMIGIIGPDVVDATTRAIHGDDAADELFGLLGDCYSGASIAEPGDDRVFRNVDALIRERENRGDSFSIIDEFPLTDDDDGTLENLREHARKNGLTINVGTIKPETDNAAD